MIKATLIFILVMVLILAFVAYVLFRTVQAHDERFDRQGGAIRHTNDRIRTAEIEQKVTKRNLYSLQHGNGEQFDALNKRIEFLEKGVKAMNDGVKRILTVKASTEDGDGAATIVTHTYKAASAQGWPTLIDEDGNSIARINPKYAMQFGKVDIFHIDDCVFTITINNKKE